MYHPYHPVPGVENIRQEWIELLNAGVDSVHVAGWQLNDGVNYVFRR